MVQSVATRLEATTDFLGCIEMLPPGSSIFGSTDGHFCIFQIKLRLFLVQIPRPFSLSAPVLKLLLFEHYSITICKVCQSSSYTYVLYVHLNVCYWIFQSYILTVSFCTTMTFVLCLQLCETMDNAPSSAMVTNNNRLSYHITQYLWNFMCHYDKID